MVRIFNLCDKNILYICEKNILSTCQKYLNILKEFFYVHNNQVARLVFLRSG